MSREQKLEALKLLLEDEDSEAILSLGSGIPYEYSRKSNTTRFIYKPELESGDLSVSSRTPPELELFEIFPHIAARSATPEPVLEEKSIYRSTAARTANVVPTRKEKSTHHDLKVNKTNTDSENALEPHISEMDSTQFFLKPLNPKTIKTVLTTDVQQRGSSEFESFDESTNSASVSAGDLELASLSHFENSSAVQNSNSDSVSTSDVSSCGSNISTMTTTVSQTESISGPFDGIVREERTTLRVLNLSKNTKSNQLRAMLKGVMGVTRFHEEPHPLTDSTLNCTYIMFESAKLAAIAHRILNGLVLDNHTLHCEYRRISIKSQVDNERQVGIIV